jgi:hypothetical protein
VWGLRIGLKHLDATGADRKDVKDNRAKELSASSSPLGCFVDRVEKCGVACAVKHDESAMKCRLVTTRLVTTNMAEKRRQMTKAPHCLETRTGGNFGVELVQGLDRELQSLDSEVLVSRRTMKALEMRTSGNLGVALVQGLDREVKCLVTTNGTEKGRPTKKRTEEGRPTKNMHHAVSASF